jgi:predicted dehydrogenase
VPDQSKIPAVIRWGILGCGNIARHAIAPAIGWSNNGALAAIASRDVDRAQALASELGAERAHGSYEALLDDPDVDAIYIGLPNGLHERWAIRAAEAGKHVLCEKSLALDLASARRIERAFATRKLRLVEAFMYRHHPQWSVVRAHLPAIGSVRLLHASLCGTAAPGDHRWSSELGGGALFDVTCYGVDVARWLIGEPARVRASAHIENGVDVSSQALLEFESGALASISGSLRSAFDQSLVIVGEGGRIEVRKPFIPDWSAAEIAIDGRSIEVPGANHFLHEVEHFASLVLDPSKEMAPAESGVANAAVLAAIRDAFRRASVSVSSG